MRTAYDAIVVGARCAGSPTAMLLARRVSRFHGGDAAQLLSQAFVPPPGMAAGPSIGAAAT